MNALRQSQVNGEPVVRGRARLAAEYDDGLYRYVPAPPVFRDAEGYPLEDGMAQNESHQRETAYWCDILQRRLPGATVCSDLPMPYRHRAHVGTLSQLSCRPFDPPGNPRRTSPGAAVWLAQARAGPPAATFAPYHSRIPTCSATAAVLFSLSWHNAPSAVLADRRGLPASDAALWFRGADRHQPNEAISPTKQPASPLATWLVARECHAIHPSPHWCRSSRPRVRCMQSGASCR